MSDTTKTLTNSGQFKKGVSGNPRGRPKKDKAKEAQKMETLAAVYAEANGDPIKVMEGMLANGAVLELTVSEGLRIARDLAPYRKAKLSSVDTTVKEDKQVTVVFDNALAGPDMTLIEDETK